MIDYLELLLDIQEQEEPEEEITELEARFFSVVPSRTRTGDKAAAKTQKAQETQTRMKKEALTLAEEEMPEEQADPPKMEAETGRIPADEGGMAAGSRTDQVGPIKAWISKDGTARIETNADEMPEAGGMELTRAETKKIGASSGEIDVDKLGGIQAPGIWAAGAGRTGPGTDIAETVAAISAAAEIGSVGLKAAETPAAETQAAGTQPAGTQPAGTKAAEAGIARALAARRQLEETLSGGTGGTETSGVSSLYQQMAQAEQAVSSLRQNTRVVSAAENSSAAPGIGAAELDEIFSRDARRYDGGFSLF